MSGIFRESERKGPRFPSGISWRMWLPEERKQSSVIYSSLHLRDGFIGWNDSHYDTPRRGSNFSDCNFHFVVRSRRTNFIFIKVHYCLFALDWLWIIMWLFAIVSSVFCLWTNQLFISIAIWNPSSTFDMQFVLEHNYVSENNTFSNVSNFQLILKILFFFSGTFQRNWCK